jgi:hypothetical protein
MAYGVFGMTSVGGRKKRFEDASIYWNQGSSPVAIPSKCFSSDSCSIRNISTDTATRATVWAGHSKLGTQRRENFLNLWHAPQEALRKCSGTAKKIFLRRYRKFWPKVKGGHWVRGAFLQDKSPFLNFWSQILI